MRSEPEMITSLRNWAEDYDKVRAVLLTSSRVNPTARTDLFSDYDVVLVLSDVARLAETTEWLAAFGRVISHFRDEFTQFDKRTYTRLALYEDGVKIDFSLWPVAMFLRLKQSPALPDYLDIGYRVLLDKDGLTAGLPVATHRAHIPQPPSEAAYQALVQEFWWETTYVARNLWRDDLYFAKYNLDYIIRFDLLQKLLEWYVEIRYGWSLRPGVRGKGLKRLLDAETWAELERTYAGAGIEENWAALFATIRLFRRIAMSVAESLGFQYPDHTDADVTAYLEKIRRLPLEATDFV